jgi:hypothetical protein
MFAHWLVVQCTVDGCLQDQAQGPAGRNTPRSVAERPYLVSAVTFTSHHIALKSRFDPVKNPAIA